MALDTLLVEKIKNNEISSINLDSRGLGDEDVKELTDLLKDNSSVESVSLGWNKIGVEAAKYLAGLCKNNTTLKSINLWSCELNDEATKTLARGLENNFNLQSINLGHNKIGGVGTKSLTGALKNKLALQSLDLGGNPIGAEGAKGVEELLKSKTGLLSVDLSFGNIGDEGSKYLAKGIENNNTLQTINLRENNIGEDGTSYLTNALETNTTLQTLNLRENHIGNKGAEYVADLIRNNTTLQYLHLGWNKIGDVGFKHLTDGFENNTTLRTIELQYNNLKFASEGAKYLAEKIKNNISLQKIELDDYIGTDLKEQIYNQINFNRKIAAQLKPVTFFRTAALDGEIISKSIKELETLVPGLISTTEPLDDEHALAEMYRLLTGLGHMTVFNGFVDAWDNLATAFTHPALQATADIALAQLLFTADEPFKKATADQQTARWLTVLYGLRNDMQRPELRTWAYTAWLKLNHPDKTISSQDIKNTQSNIALLSNTMMLQLARKALANCPAEEVHEKTLLEDLSVRQHFHLTTLHTLARSPAFIAELKREYPEVTKYVVIEEAMYTNGVKCIHDIPTDLLPVTEADRDHYALAMSLVLPSIDLALENVKACHSSLQGLKENLQNPATTTAPTGAASFFFHKEEETKPEESDLKSQKSRSGKMG